MEDNTCDDGEGDELNRIEHADDNLKDDLEITTNTFSSEVRKG